MESFELGRKIDKDGFCLVMSVEQRKHSESPWGIEPMSYGPNIGSRSL